MRALARFETFVEHLIEGTFARLPGGSLQPVHIAKQILREMEDNQAIGPGRVYVPNRFSVNLSPDEHSILAPIAPALCRELTSYATDSAAEHGWSFLGTVEVSLAPDPTVRRGHVRIIADSVADDGSAATARDDIQHTLAIRLPAQDEATPAARLLLDGAPGAVAYPLLRDVVTLGRALDNDLVLEHPGVSRHHAEIRRESGGYTLTDLESTNGTAVNGRRVTTARLRDGDRVRLGGLEFTFHLASTGERRS